MLEPQFFTAGKAIFTVDNGKGDHYTYRVDRTPPKDNYPEAWLVKLLTGPNNTRDYTYLGKLNPTTGQVTLTQKSRYQADTTPVRVVQWALNRVWEAKNLPEGYQIRHEGRCGRCGAPLTNPKSLDTGLGPECIKK